jgi:conjugal transfer mating pair stabilization protein TraN
MVKKTFKRGSYGPSSRYFSSFVWFIYFLCFLCFFLISPRLLANPDFQNAYKDGSSIAGQLKGTANDAMSQVSSELPINNNPAQTKYYGGITQTSSNANKISQDAATLVNNTEVGNSVKKSFNERPMYEVDKDSYGMKKADLITKDADNIARGVSSEYADCSKVGEKCETTYVNSVCTESGRASSRTCIKSLAASTELRESNRDIRIVIGPVYNETNITIDLILGQIVSIEPVKKGKKNKKRPNEKINVSVSPLLPSISCTTLDKKYTLQKDNWFGTFKVITEPSCNNHFQLKVNISGGYWQSATFTISYHFHNQDKIINETWNNGCLALEQDAAAGICTLNSEICSVPGSTKIINGTSITRDCWEKTAIYQYGGTAVDNSSCDTLRKKGCEQIMSSCSVRKGDYCLAYNQTFRCPEIKCSTPKGIVCNGTAFCLDGSCVDQSYKSNDDFYKEASNLTGVMDASKQLDGGNNGNYSIFNGQAHECSRSMLGYYNCCDYTGWGVNWNLVKCNDEEKKLAQDRKNRLAIKLGKYCAHKVPLTGICTSHHERYCVFKSKQARIIQEQGRRKQLRIGFGSAESPNCQGITPEKMQQIKFDQIDFSELYDDLKQKTKIPQAPSEIERINKRVQQSYTQGRKHQ